MSSIELTSEHKSKLLEMCEALFPEYTIYEVQKANHFGRIVNTVQGNKWEYNGDDDEPIDEFFIHWFEFCMRYLTSKLDLLYFEKIMNPLDPFHVSNKNKNLEYPENWKELWENRPFEKFNKICNGSEYKKHPIDYLYEQFKQLK